MTQQVLDVDVEWAVAHGSRLSKECSETPELRMTEEEAVWLFAEAKKPLKHSIIASCFKQKFKKEVVGEDWNTTSSVGHAVR